MPPALRSGAWIHWKLKNMAKADMNYTHYRQLSAESGEVKKPKTNRFSFMGCSLTQLELDFVYSTMLCGPRLGVPSVFCQDFIHNHKFHPTRRWMFDFAWPKYKVAVEVVGGTWVGVTHRRDHDEC